MNASGDGNRLRTNFATGCQESPRAQDTQGTLGAKNLKRISFFLQKIMNGYLSRGHLVIV